MFHFASEARLPSEREIKDEVTVILVESQYLVVDRPRDIAHVPGDSTPCPLCG
jgi:hypothetical protein